MDFPRIIPPIECNDGTKLSVQGSEFHYCSPRKAEGPYTSVEVMCAPVEAWSEYDAEGVYAYVPTKMVLEFIALHGGLALGYSWFHNHIQGQE